MILIHKYGLEALIQEEKMKKIILGFVIVLTLCCVSLAGADEGNQFASFSDQDLLRLLNAVQDEAARRGLNGDVIRTLSAGKYIIGKDIPAGNYRVTCLTTGGEDLNNAYTSLGNAYDALGEEPGSNYGSIFGALGDLFETIAELELNILGGFGEVLQNVSLKKGESVPLTLQDGTALEVIDGSCELKKQ